MIAKIDAALQRLDEGPTATARNRGAIGLKRWTPGDRNSLDRGAGTPRASREGLPGRIVREPLGLSKNGAVRPRRFICHRCVVPHVRLTICGSRRYRREHPFHFFFDRRLLAGVLRRRSEYRFLATGGPDLRTRRPEGEKRWRSPLISHRACARIPRPLPALRAEAERLARQALYRLERRLGTGRSSRAAGSTGSERSRTGVKSVCDGSMC